MNIKLASKRLFVLTLLCLSMATLSACSKTTEVVEEKQPVVKDYDYYIRLLRNAPKENLDDPKQWDGYRLEFENTTGFNSEVSHLFSMKTDGSDIRLVAEPDLISPGAKHYYFMWRERSPNNRYLLARVDTEGREPETILLDLKTRTRKVLDQSSNKARIKWTADSKTVYYYSDKGLMRYDVADETLTEMEPSIGSRMLFPLFNGNFISTLDSYYVYVAPGKVTLGRWKFHRNWYSSAAYALSPNERYLMVSNIETCIYDLEVESIQPIYCAEDLSTNHTDITNEGIYDWRSSLQYWPFNGQTPTQVKLRGLDLNKLRIINRQLGQEGHPNYYFLNKDVK